MKTAVVAIGVNQVRPPFTPLLAAVTGAQKIAAWGTSQGFAVFTLCDSDNEKVTLEKVSATIKHIVDDGTYAKLFVYFSGHGVLLAPTSEVWLLSGAPDTPSEAISVNLSIATARFCGFEHVIFISDACRTPPNSYGAVSALTPSCIFPFLPPKPNPPPVDTFYATLPGSPAYEVEAASGYEGGLTSCVVDAFNGQFPDLVEALPSSAETRWVVKTTPMKTHLEKYVPRFARKNGATSSQDPDIRIESTWPAYFSDVSKIVDNKYLSRKFPPAASSAKAPRDYIAYQYEADGAEYPVVKLKPAKKAAPAKKMAQAPGGKPQRARTLDHAPISKYFDASEIDSQLLQLGKSVGRRPQKLRPKRPQKSSNALEARILSIRAAHDFARRRPTLSIVVVGAHIRQAFLVGDCPEYSSVIYQGEHSCVEIHGPASYLYDDLIPPMALLIQLDDGRGACLPIFAHHAGVVVVDEHGINAMSYLPWAVDENPHWNEVASRHARVAAMAGKGQFTFHSAFDAEEGAKYLRMLKHVDPVLAIFAANAYVQSGNFRELMSVFSWMKSAPGPMPFDVALLAAQFTPNGPTALNFAPWMPMLTQSWLMLGRFEAAIPAVLRDIRKNLQTSLYTTFSREGMKLLFDHFEAK